ncbi:MAG: helix-turn-helix transcriptional regulator [Cellulosilyticaceae bacterium]
MEFDKEHLSYVYKQIRIIWPLNCIFKSGDYPSHIRIEQYKMPDRIRKEEAAVMAYYLDVLPEDEIEAIYSYEDSFRLRYIGISMKVEDLYRGHIILGPYLNNRLEACEIRQLLLSNEIEIREKSSLIELYDTVPIISILEEITLGKMAHMLLQFGNRQVRYITPDGHSENKRVLEEQRDNTKENKRVCEVQTYDLKDLSTARSCLAEKEIIYYIYQGDWKRALKSLMEISESFVEKTSDSHLINFKNLILTLNGMIRYALINYSIDIQRVRQVTTKVCSQVNQADKMAELQFELKEMIVDYCELVNDMKNNSYSQVVLGATRHIRFNFDKEITLKGLAEQLYVHPNYLSRKFKEETGSQMSDYINQVRIEQSQLLLNNPMLTITDIAYRVGYKDEKYFSKVFKKYVQKTPSEYRNS